MTYLIKVDWQGLKAGTSVGAEALAGCNLTALLARGVLEPAPAVPSRKRKPEPPADDTADEPEEL